MGWFGEMLWILPSVGLYVQFSAILAVDNHVSGNALFTEVPHDMLSQAGDDVEMSCSFRGATSSSISLEIQWWYTRHSREWAEQPAWATNQVVSQENTPKGATKISVVKVVGSNISHKLRLSSVKPSDEGTYECRVIDFSESRAQRHQVQAYLQVQQTTSGPEDHQKIHQETEAAQRTRQESHRSQHQPLHEGNKTRRRSETQ